MGQESGESQELSGRAKSLANLRPWKPGQSGNPKGRTSKKRLFEEAFLEAALDGKDTILGVLMAVAKSGNMQAIQMILDRVVPKVEKHEFETDAVPSKLVIEFQKPDTGEGGEGGGDAG